MSISDTSTFCPYPWEYLFVDNFGYYQTCCISERPLNSPDMVKASEKDSIKRHWNSLYMQEMRRQLKTKQKHPDCIACWRMEKLGDITFREFAILEEIFSKEEEAIEILPPPTFKAIDLRFGNTCNLACRMCIPYNSSRLINEYSELQGAEYQEQYRKMNWYESEDFWEELIGYIDQNTRRIHLAGGEPLIIKQCWKFLKRLVDLGKSKDLILSYNTNLSVLPDEVKELWPKFKGVQLIVSIDGVGKVNEYIRWPLKWDVFDRNLREINDNFEKYNIMLAEPHVTSQVYNIFRTDEICDYIASLKNFRIPRFDVLWGPIQFNTQVLPEWYREEAALRMEAYIEKLKNGHNNLEQTQAEALSKNINSLINHLRTNPGRTEEFQLFKRHTDIYDRHRNQRTFDFIPELERAYGDQ
jgi:sulfatase maturation enzyme AslB (radical SAM superfamily)